MNKILLFIIGFLSLFTSCNKKDFSQTTTLVKSTFDSLLVKKARFIVVIPNQGCDGCISAAEDFFFKNRDRDDILFIFTNLDSQKIFKLKMKEAGIPPTQKNLFIDYDNRFYNSLSGKNKIYPTIFIFIQDAIRDSFIKSPHENGFAFIEQFDKKLYEKQ